MKFTRWAVLAMAAVAVAVALWPAGQARAAASRVTPEQRTCAAFRAWVARPTPGRLNTTMRDSVSAKWHPLGLDVVVLFTTVRQGDHLDQPAEVQAVAQDCRHV